MLKKILIIIFATCIFYKTANADVCYYINKQTIKNAVEIIKKQKEVFKYCSICPSAEALKIAVKNISETSPIAINGTNVDIAHLYYFKNNNFINIGIEAGCIKNGQYGIEKSLNKLPILYDSKEKNMELIEAKIQKIHNKCSSLSKNKNNITTNDMIDYNSQCSQYFIEEIKKEIKTAFSPHEQTKMLEYLSQSENAIFNFYNNIYSANKYCDGQCGTMATYLPYIDKISMLEKMLKKLLYLNLTKNGY
ncbi:MAG: hypothetical protein IJZ59_02805 [Alphaproteobacteria bacterium]|nr:hypothetical protein [Alphaproteobacteria bacterium]